MKYCRSGNIREVLMFARRTNSQIQELRKFFLYNYSATKENENSRIPNFVESSKIRNSRIFKAAPWDDINFRFLFCSEVVYPTDHDFIFYGIFTFLKIFFIRTFMNPTVNQTNFLYI